MCPEVRPYLMLKCYMIDSFRAFGTVYDDTYHETVEKIMCLLLCFMLCWSVLKRKAFLACVQTNINWKLMLHKPTDQCSQFDDVQSQNQHEPRNSIKWCFVWKHVCWPSIIVPILFFSSGSFFGKSVVPNWPYWSNWHAYYCIKSFCMSCKCESFSFNCSIFSFWYAKITKILSYSRMVFKIKCTLIFYCVI